MVIAPVPFFDHPEYDLAMVDIFAVLDVRLTGYHEAGPLDSGAWEHRNLGLLPADLAGVTCHDESSCGHRMLARRADAQDPWL